MKIALIYTAKSDELKNSLERSLLKTFGEGMEAEEYQDVSVLTDSARAGPVTKEAAARYAELILHAARNGADGILSTCCVMGDAVEQFKAFLDFTGTPLVSIDESFCRKALLECKKICLLATAPVAAFSVRHTMERYERTLGTYPSLDTLMVKDPNGLSKDAFNGAYDGIILAQPSMAFAAEQLRKESGLKVYSAVDDPFGVLKEKIAAKFN